MMQKQRDPLDYEQLARELAAESMPAAMDYLEALDRFRAARPRSRVLVQRLRVLRTSLRAAFIARHDTQLRFIVLVTARSLRDVLDNDQDAVTVSAASRGVRLGRRPLEAQWRFGAGSVSVRSDDLRLLLAEADRELPGTLAALTAERGAVIWMRFDLDRWFGMGDLRDQLRASGDFWGTEFGYAGT